MLDGNYPILSPFTSLFPSHSGQQTARLVCELTKRRINLSGFFFVTLAIDDGTLSDTQRFHLPLRHFGLNSRPINLMEPKETSARPVSTAERYKKSCLRKHRKMSAESDLC